MRLPDLLRVRIAEYVLVNDGSLRQLHVSHSPPIAVHVDSLDVYSLPKNEVGGELLGSGSEGLAFLGAVDAVKPDLHRVLIVQDGNRIAVCDPDYLSLPGLSWEGAE